MTICPCGQTANERSKLGLCPSCSKARKVALNRGCMRQRRRRQRIADQKHQEPRKYTPGEMNPNRPQFQLGESQPIGVFTDAGIPVRRLESLMPRDIRSAREQEPRTDAEMEAWRKRNA